MTITQRMITHEFDRRVREIIGVCGHGATMRRLISQSGKSAANVPKIAAPPMILNAGLDERINGGWEYDTAGLKANGREFGIHFFPIVNHGVHNATTPRNDGEAAEPARKRTFAFFETHLT